MSQNAAVPPTGSTASKRRSGQPGDELKAFLRVFWAGPVAFTRALLSYVSTRMPWPKPTKKKAAKDAQSLARTNSARAASRAAARRLVKDRPLSLDQRYSPMTESDPLDDIFVRVRESFFGAISGVNAQSTTPVSVRRRYLRESGRVASKRLYFYLKPLNEIGWLFERSGSGWVVSRAEKIVGQGTFMRPPDAWDIVVLHKSLESPGLVRVSSQRFSTELMPFSVYEQKLLTAVLSE